MLGGCRKINEEPNYRCDSEEWATTVLNDSVEEVLTSLVSLYLRKKRIYQSQPKLKNNGMLPFIVLTLTTALNNKSLYYKVYDNGAGEMLYEEYEPKNKENSQN
ncbi:hypothetical protein [Helicobacter sp.]|uniref:hypothetical protein n=1 Tax=Helicobacter sp. TaxID=218 RepID=UPI0025C2472A|nr:hypothetical protein [Helicobacter sp.]